jgi:uncharacterized protein YpmB
MSILKYILANPKFSLKDKFYFFGFLFLLFGFIGGLLWISYKGIIRGGGIGAWDLVIIGVIISIIFKNIRKFGEKFVFPYEESKGRSKEALAALKVMDWLNAQVKVRTTYWRDIAITLTIAVLVLISIPLLFPRIIPFISSLPKEIIPIGFGLVIFLIIISIFYHFWFSPYHQKFKEGIKKINQECPLGPAEKKYFNGNHFHCAYFYCFHIFSCYISSGVSRLKDL